MRALCDGVIIGVELGKKCLRSFLLQENSTEERNGVRHLEMERKLGLCGLAKGAGQRGALSPKGEERQVTGGQRRFY